MLEKEELRSIRILPSRAKGAGHEAIFICLYLWTFDPKHACDWCKNDFFSHGCHQKHEKSTDVTYFILYRFILQHNFLKNFSSSLSFMADLTLLPPLTLSFKDLRFFFTSTSIKKYLCQFLSLPFFFPYCQRKVRLLSLPNLFLVAKTKKFVLRVPTSLCKHTKCYLFNHKVHASM